MPDLLSAAERADFFSAIGDVTDTFYKQSVNYEQRGVAFDRMQTDGKDNSSTKTLLCRVTTKPSDKLKQDAGGGFDYKDVEVRFNFAYLGAQGLVDGNGKAAFEVENDYLTFAGERYKITKVHFDDSGVDTNYAICCVEARREEKIG